MNLPGYRSENLLEKLAGKRVLITRPEQRAGEWVESFRRAGAVVLHIPTLAMGAATLQEQNYCLQLLREKRTVQEDSPDFSAGVKKSWLAFTSVIAAQQTVEMLKSMCAESLLCEFRLAAIGSATAEVLRESIADFHKRGATVKNCEVPPVVIPSVQNGKALAEAILALDPSAEVIHPASDRALQDFSRTIRQCGGVAHTLIICHHLAADGAGGATLIGELQRGLDLLTFASPSAVSGAEELASASPGAVELLRDCRALAIGPTTAEALRAAGFSRVWVSPSPLLEDFLQIAAAAVVS